MKVAMHGHFRKELIISLAVIVGSFLVSGAALYFLSGDLQSQVQKIGTARALLTNRSAVLGSLAALKKDAAQAAVYKPAMDVVLVSQDQLLDFQKWLDGLAGVHRIGYNFSFQGDPVLPQSDAPGYYNFSLDINGALDNLIEFIKDVEYKSPRFLTNLYGFDLTRDGDNYRVLTQGKVFFR
jgi:outer membrane murein-binding lipoprotein Lpp